MPRTGRLRISGARPRPAHTATVWPPASALVIDVGVVAVTLPWMLAAPPNPRPKPPPPGAPLARGPRNWPVAPRLAAAVDGGVVNRPTANATPATATSAA